MTQRHLVSSAALAWTFFVLAPVAIAEVSLSREIPYAESVRVRPAVREKCQLTTRIPEAIAASSEGVDLVEGAGTLKVEIAAVHAPGGGVFSGPKWIELRGSFGDASFRAKRYSATDVFSGGTCGILAKISRALGQDIAGWLDAPSDGAELGDAK